MRVLWLCNICLPVIAEKLGIPSSSKEGWLTGLSSALVTYGENNKLELAVCFPLKTVTPGTFQKGMVSGMTYYAFYEDVTKETLYEKTMDTALPAIIRDYQPDLVHAFGTEFPHTLAMAKAYGRPERMLIGMQGICQACAEHFCDGIPDSVKNRFTLRDFLKQDNIRQQQEKFLMRAEHEKQAIALTGNITGRTAFDKNYVESIHAGIRYHFMNETLRSNFYYKKWKLSECDRHTIFFSQGDYPLKGFHLFLEALPFIRKIVPNVKVYVGGNNIIKQDTLKNRLKLSSYGKYLLELIHRNQLEDTVILTGMLNADGMCDRMLKTHVFVSSSMIENSPNSVGEAMLLGVPVVSSEVGGVPDMMEAEKEGLFYPALESNQLAHQIVRIFSDDRLAEKLSTEARNRAAVTHDPQINTTRLLEIYDTITKNGEEK
ncbi:MAG: glycosyltransferase family 4 protein [Lachnospiraceae bacterium]|nr:glycosyltransferase family 4 protein [Lachnospiraceae bacterium]